MWHRHQIAGESVETVEGKFIKRVRDRASFPLGGVDEVLGSQVVRKTPQIVETHDMIGEHECVKGHNRIRDGGGLPTMAATVRKSEPTYPDDKRATLAFSTTKSTGAGVQSRGSGGVTDGAITTNHPARPEKLPVRKTQSKLRFKVES